MKIWIDLENTPHAVIFRPIIQQLRERGHEVVVTAKDYGQTLGLLKLYGIGCIPVGAGKAKGRVAKGLAVIQRAIKLARIVGRNHVDVSISHGSRSHVIGSWMIGVPSITAYDYEFTFHLPMMDRLVDLFLVPACLKNTLSVSVRNSSKKIRLYPGFKEELYLYDFIPSSKIVNELRLPVHKTIITIRPPAVTSHYHHALSEELFERVMERVFKEHNVFAIVLPRFEGQKKEITDKFGRDKQKILIPDLVVNGLDLIWNSDLVISGGGTMNREAALLGVPVYSIFSAPLGAVDEYLISTGQLKHIVSLNDISLIKFSKRKSVKFVPPTSKVLDYFIETIENGGNWGIKK